MRFILQLSLSKQSVDLEMIPKPEWIQDLLPVRNEFSFEGILMETFTYESFDKSIIEANWDKPWFVNEEYFIFLGGHVLYRIKEADKKGKYVPKPEEVLKIILSFGDNHYDVLKGNYYIILFKRLTRTVSVFSSPLSLYPAWYIIQNNIFIISNLMESLIKVKKGLSMNPQGLVEFTLFDHCLGSGTIYKDIFQLSAGSLLSITEKSRKERLVYDIRKWVTNKPVRRKDSLEDINSILKRHITEFTKSVKKLNISLTGGFDGRLNFSFLDKSDYSRLQAFSYGMENSLQLLIPEMISKQLKFQYKKVLLEEEFEAKYADLGYNTILYSGGISPFIRANYPFGYGKIKDFSRNCILGQCDMIRPLYTNPAGAIFNNFSHDLFYNERSDKYFNEYLKLSKSGFIDKNLFTYEIFNKIYQFVRDTYILPYQELNNHEQYYLFLMKESMLKYWHTECHIVDLFVNDFISFSDLDYIETISKSEYFGLYKGIFASNQFRRRKGQDLYADLMHLNNNELNNIIVDRLYKPKWIRHFPVGYIFLSIGKLKAHNRKKKFGNDTFGGSKWSEIFYKKYKNEMFRSNRYFNSDALLAGMPYRDNNEYRYDRHISLKIWLQYIGIY